MPNRRRTIFLALAGLLLSVIVGVPVLQKFSIEMMQLQFRERILSEQSTVSDIAGAFGVSSTRLAVKLNLEKMSPEQFGKMTLAEVATQNGMSIRDVKAIVAEVVIGEQVRGSYGWTLWLHESSNVR